MPTYSRAITAILTLLPLGGLGVKPVGAHTPLPEAAASAESAHDIHLTYTRMVVDGASVVCRIRLFKDDLERALREFAREPTLRVAATPGTDSIFAAYFNTRASLTADGEALRGKVLQSGVDADATDQQMWWYLVELPARKPIRSLAVRIALLFETFRDQKNVVTVLRMPGEERHSMYFAGEDAKEQRLDFKP